MEEEDAIDRIGQELMAAIEAALAADPRVQACLHEARAAGIGFRVALNDGRRAASRARADAEEPAAAGAARPGMKAAPADSVTESDRRFLRSLRIAADEG